MGELVLQMAQLLVWAVAVAVLGLRLQMQHLQGGVMVEMVLLHP
jgi:hypothetical protein